MLPFVNMSDDKGNEYFSDGISEELLNVLVRVDGLGVASRTSSFSYKGSPLGTADIAKALKVNHVLEGSVRKAGNHVRITAQLIDAVNDRHLWSETYDRELTDIFAIQEEIANSIVAALRDQLGTAKSATSVVTVRADTENLEAYELYLKARELFIARKDLPESIRLFEQVTQMDPGFARGWEGLAAVYAVANSWGIDDRDYAALAKSAAERALQLDPALSMPWAALATAEQQVWPVDWSRSLQLLDRAIAADAHNSTAFLWRGIAWVDLGFFERAIADFEHCLVLDPKYQNCTRWKAIGLLYLGKTEPAMKLFEQGVANGFIKNRAETFVAPMVRRGDRVGAMLVLRELRASPAVIVKVLQAIERPAPVAAADLSLIEHDVLSVARPGDQTVTLARVYLWLGLVRPDSGQQGRHRVFDDAMGAGLCGVSQFQGVQADAARHGYSRLLARARLPAAVPGGRRKGFHMRLKAVRPVLARAAARGLRRRRRWYQEAASPPPPPPPPPVQEPPVFSTPTAVRVTAATPFTANCLTVPAGATAYVNSEVEPHLAIDATNPNHLVAGWQQDRMSDGGARGLMTAVSVDGGTTWSPPQASPFSRCAGGTFERVSDPWVASHGTTTLQIGIAFSGGTFTTGARSAVLVSRSGDGGATWGAAIPLVDDDGCGSSTTRKRSRSTRRTRATCTPRGTAWTRATPASRCWRGPPTAASPGRRP